MVRNGQQKLTLWLKTLISTIFSVFQPNQSMFYLVKKDL